LQPRRERKPCTVLSRAELLDMYRLILPLAQNGRRGDQKLRKQNLIFLQISGAGTKPCWWPRGGTEERLRLVLLPLLRDRALMLTLGMTPDRDAPSRRWPRRGPESPTRRAPDAGALVSSARTFCNPARPVRSSSRRWVARRGAAPLGPEDIKKPSLVPTRI